MSKPDRICRTRERVEEGALDPVAEQPDARDGRCGIQHELVVVEVTRERLEVLRRTRDAVVDARLRRSSADCFVSPHFRHVFTVFSPFFSRLPGAGVTPPT